MPFGTIHWMLTEKARTGLDVVVVRKHPSVFLCHRIQSNWERYLPLHVLTTRHTSVEEKLPLLNGEVRRLVSFPLFPVMDLRAKTPYVHI